jgi:hypothetical protein
LAMVRPSQVPPTSKKGVGSRGAASPRS